MPHIEEASNAWEPGGFIEYQILPGGDLKMKLTAEGREFLQDYISEQDENSVEFTTGVDVLLYGLFESWFANSDWDHVSSEDIGALTDAPIISDRVDRDDKGSLGGLGNVWWYSNYAVTDPVEEMILRGETVWQKAPEAEGIPTEESVRKVSKKGKIEAKATEQTIRFGKRYVYKPIFIDYFINRNKSKPNGPEGGQIVIVTGVTVDSKWADEYDVLYYDFSDPKTNKQLGTACAESFEFLGTEESVRKVTERQFIRNLLEPRKVIQEKKDVKEGRMKSAGHDVDIRQGGLFIDPKDGEAVEVIDLDSAAGVDGCNMVLSGNIYLLTGEELRSALSVIGAENPEEIIDKVEELSGQSGAYEFPEDMSEEDEKVIMEVWYASHVYGGFDGYMENWIMVPKGDEAYKYTQEQAEEIAETWKGELVFAEDTLKAIEDILENFDVEL